MAKEKSNNIMIFIIVSVILVFATWFLTYTYTLNQSPPLQGEVLNFFEEYSVSLNNIHVASSIARLASINLNQLNDYTQEDYYYIFAEEFVNVGKTYATDAKKHLQKTKIKLEKIQDSAPNDFFKEDVLNRIEQTNLLIIYASQVYTLLDYAQQQLYEINYGSEIKANEYWKKYNDLIPEFNDNLKKLSDTQQRIDLYWDQDWYPIFQETESI